MREILFRGKSIDDDKFVYGYVGVFKGTTQIYVPFTEEEEKENEGHIFSVIGGLWYTVQPDTVGQFTGLTDENGKKIFEGDIVKLKDGSTCVVRYGRHDLWCCGCCFDSHESVGFYLDEGDGSAYSGDNAWGLVEVIGNIHDQPELVMPPKGE